RFGLFSYFISPAKPRSTQSRAKSKSRARPAGAIPTRSKPASRACFLIAASKPTGMMIARRSTGLYERFSSHSGSGLSCPAAVRQRRFNLEARHSRLGALSAPRRLLHFEDNHLVSLD